MKRLNQFGLFLSPIGILVGISLLWTFVVRPQVVELIRHQIPRLNSAQDYVDVDVTDIDISFLKLQLSAGYVNLKFKNSLSELAPLQVKRARFQLDPFKLLVGQVSLSKIQLDQVTWSFRNKNATQKKKSDELPLDELFKIASEIPIEQIFIDQSEVKFVDEELKLDVNFEIPHLVLANKKKSLGLNLKGLSVSPANLAQSHVQAELDLIATLRYDKNNSLLDVSSLHLRTLDSNLDLKANLIHLKQLLIRPEGQLKIQSEIHFEDLRTIGLSLFPQKTRMPAITGSAQLSGELIFKSFDDVNGQLAVETKQVNVDHFKLGQAQMRAEIKKNQIFINQIELEHPSALAYLKKIEIEQKSPYRFKSAVQVKNFDLQKLFGSVGLAEIPAGLSAEANAQCNGLVEPEFKIECDVDSDLQDIWVRPSQKAKLHIVKIKKAKIAGKFEMNPQKMSYTASLKVGESVGSSTGQVSFAEGFNFNFETEKLSFSDVESLADLNFKGDLKIKGTTSGDSAHGIFNAHADFTNAEIDGFKLGRLASEIKYEKGRLELNSIDGILGKSAYVGGLEFNFVSSMMTAQLQMKDLYGEDVLLAIKDKFGIPFSWAGRGRAQIDLSGPFDFWKLKYDLNAHLEQGQIADEGFEVLQLNLKANGNAIHFDQSFLKKYKSKLLIEGDITTTEKEPVFAMQIKSQPLWIEEIEHLVRLAPNVAGQAWIEGQVKGKLTNPELSFNFNAKQMSFENNDYPGSQGFVSIDRKNFKFNGQLFGRQIQSDLLWPWDAADPYSLRLQIRDLNPLMLLPTISIPMPSSEFYSRLNADIDLKANHRNLQSSEGFVRITDFMLQRGALYLKLNRPASLNFKNGMTQMDPVDFKGESNSLQINLASPKKDETKVTVNGDLQLRQFQFLVPFVQTMSGRVQVNTQILLKENDFELLGDGEITDGTIGIKGFPQAIENINTPLEFSKSKILFSDLSAQLGQNEIAGQGQVDIKGSHQINVNVQAASDNIEIIFPEKVNTAGKVDLSFTGAWLPYTLKIDYKVAHGLVEKDFGQDSSQNKSTLKSSPYLPPRQIEMQTPSLLLDVAIDLSQGVVVKNQLLEGEATGQLKVTGTPENPIIAGQIDIKTGSKLNFKDKQFDIQTATIKFPGTAEVNPEIYMTANARVSDYDISLLVQGVPSKNLTIKPTSQPPLSEPDIFSLLALGLTSSKLDQNLSSQTQQNQTGLEVLAAISNQSQINKKFQEKFGLTVQLAPTVDSTKNIAVPKVVVSKKIQKNVNASYSRPLGGDTQNQEWKLQYLFNPNKSLILNYQNVETNQQDQIRNTNNNDQGILGLDFEYKKEFK